MSISDKAVDSAVAAEKDGFCIRATSAPANSMKALAKGTWSCSLQPYISYDHSSKFIGCANRCTLDDWKRCPFNTGKVVRKDGV